MKFATKFYSESTSATVRGEVIMGDTYAQVAKVGPRESRNAGNGDAKREVVTSKVTNSTFVIGSRNRK